MEIMNMWEIGNERMFRDTIYPRNGDSSKPLSRHL